MDQLVEIIKVLGTPTREEIKAMNPNYTEFKFPQIKAHPWNKVRAHLGSSVLQTHIFLAAVAIIGCPLQSRSRAGLLVSACLVSV